MCTLHSFPHNIDHCLTFARSEFEGLMEKAPSEANAFLADPAKYIAAIRQVWNSGAACSRCLGQCSRAGLLGCTKCRANTGMFLSSLGRFSYLHMQNESHSLFVRQCGRSCSCRMHSLSHDSDTFMRLGCQASDAAAREQLEKVVEVLGTERCTTMEDCIAWARNKFQARPAPPRCPGLVCYWPQSRKHGDRLASQLLHARDICTSCVGLRGALWVLLLLRRHVRSCTGML